MVKEKDGRRLGDLCDWMGEAWRLYCIGPEYYHVRRITDNGTHADETFYTHYRDAWLDGSSPDLIWQKRQRGIPKPIKIKAWTIRA